MASPAETVLPHKIRKAWNKTDWFQRIYVLGWFLFFVVFTWAIFND